jgi:hypothetical protein
MDMGLATVKNLGIPVGDSKNQRNCSYLGYKRSDSTAHQLTNLLLTLAINTIYKTYMAVTDTDGQPPNYYRLLLLRLQYRLLLEIHKSVANNDVDRFQNYKQALWKLEQGKLKMEHLL